MVTEENLTETDQKTRLNERDKQIACNYYSSERWMIHTPVSLFKSIQYCQTAHLWGDHDTYESIGGHSSNLNLWGPDHTVTPTILKYVCDLIKHQSFL